MPVLTYIIGSIPFSYILPIWFKGIDTRKVGSRNVGGSNAIRNAGLLVGVAAGMLDFLKGYVSAQLAIHYNSLFTLSVLAVIVGHCFPIFLKFHGGRGIAPALGVLLALFPPAFVFFVVISGAGILIGEAALSTFFATLLTPVFFKLFKPEFTGVVVYISLFLIFRRAFFVIEDVKSGRDPIRSLFNRILFDSPKKERLGMIFRR